MILDDQATILRNIRVAIANVPALWPVLWENEAKAVTPPFMTAQVSVADSSFVGLAWQGRVSGVINLTFYVVAGAAKNNANAEKEAARIASLLTNLPGLRLTAPPKVIDGERDEERWKVGLVIRWEKLP